MAYRLLILIPLLVSCNGGEDPVQPPTVSIGLKIFITDDIHPGDFAADPTLPGATAIQKADAFCNSSSAKPSSDTYKALLVDGVNRDAVLLTDWVLKPNTPYYQSFNDVLIDTTTNSAIFAAYFRPMPNPVDPCGTQCGARTAWTGIGDPANFAASSAYTCLQWGQSGSPTAEYGTFGQSTMTGALAFYAGGSAYSCSTIPMALYCVQQ